MTRTRHKIPQHDWFCFGRETLFWLTNQMPCQELYPMGSTVDVRLLRSMPFELHVWAAFIADFIEPRCQCALVVYRSRANMRTDLGIPMYSNRPMLRNMYLFVGNCGKPNWWPTGWSKSHCITCGNEPYITWIFTFTGVSQVSSSCGFSIPKLHSCLVGPVTSLPSCDISATVAQRPRIPIFWKFLNFPYNSQRVLKFPLISSNKSTFFTPKCHFLLIFPCFSHIFSLFPLFLPHFSRVFFPLRCPF